MCVCVSIYRFIVIDNSTDRVTFLFFWKSPWKLYEENVQNAFVQFNRIINECYFGLMMALTELKRVVYVVCLFIFGILAWHSWESFVCFNFSIFTFDILFIICRSFQMQIWKTEKKNNKSIIDWNFITCNLHTACIPYVIFPVYQNGAHDRSMKAM